MRNYIKKSLSILMAMVVVLSYTIIGYAQMSEWENTVDVKEVTVVNRSRSRNSASVDGIARGRIISSVRLELVGNGRGSAEIYAEELCHVPVDRIKVVLTLEQKNEETGNWESVHRFENEWLSENEPNGELTMKAISMDIYGLEQGQYYRVRGIFGGYQGDLQEAWSAKTEAVYID